MAAPRPPTMATMPPPRLVGVTILWPGACLTMAPPPAIMPPLMPEDLPRPCCIIWPPRPITTEPGWPSDLT